MVDAWSGGQLGVAGIALAFAFVVAAMVFALGAASGAHINPAVTIALWSDGRFPGRRVMPYVLAQCAGAIAASFVLSALLGDAGRSGATLPAIVPGFAFLLELLMSFVLMLVILAAIEHPSPIAPLVIGLTVGFCALVGGPLTGASMNPARSLGPAMIGGHWTAHWIYWFAPLLGMLTAVRIRPRPA
jgi:MIP family channel proteins